VDQGFLSRVLPAWPGSKMGMRAFSPASAEAKVKLNAYWWRLRTLLDLPVPLVEDTRNELDPATLALDEDAQNVLVAFYNWTEAELGEEGALRPIAGLTAKAAEHAARIAGVFTFVDNEGARSIDADTMENAIQVTRWFLTEALRIAGHMQTPIEVRDAAAILRWLGKSWPHQHVGMPDLQRMGPNRLRRNRKALEKAVQVLLDRRYLFPVDSVRIDGQLRKLAWRWRPGEET
jgi:hypothetical protein